MGVCVSVCVGVCVSVYVPVGVLKTSAGLRERMRDLERECVCV